MIDEKFSLIDELNASNQLIRDFIKHKGDEEIEKMGSFRGTKNREIIDRIDKLEQEVNDEFWKTKNLGSEEEDDDVLLGKRERGSIDKVDMIGSDIGGDKKTKN